MENKNKHHVFVELTKGRVRDAKMITLDELRAEGWEPDAKGRSANVSSDWVLDLMTRKKLRDEPCELWLLDNKVAAHVSVTTHPASKRIGPLFGFAKPGAPK